MNQKIHQRGCCERIELPALSTIFPGMLVEQAPGGCQPHSTAGGPAERAFAQEDALQGGTVNGVWRNGAFVGYTSAGIDGIGIADPVQINVCCPGSLVLGLMAPGYNYTEGTKVISNGNGQLKPATGTVGTYIGVVTNLGAVNLSASGSIATLSQIRVM